MHNRLITFIKSAFDSSSFEKRAFTLFLIVSIAAHIGITLQISGIGFSFPNSATIVEIVDEDSILSKLPKEKHLIQRGSKSADIPKQDYSGKQEDTDARTDASVETSTVKVVPNGFLQQFADEKLVYNISWLGIPAGRASLEVKIEEDAGVVKIISKVRSNTLISVFYPVEDIAETTLVDYRPARSTLKQSEGRYRSDKELLFDRGNGKLIFNNYLNGERREYEMPNGEIWDVLSGFYFLRTKELVVGSSVYIDVFDSKRFWKVEVQVLRKEKIEGPGFEEINTIVVKPILKSDGLFQKKGDVIVWLTDDENKIPVRVEAEVKIGYVAADLVSKNLIEQ